jgi:hypothetical protein
MTLSWFRNTSISLRFVTRSRIYWLTEQLHNFPREDSARFEFISKPNHSLSKFRDDLHAPSNNSGSDESEAPKSILMFLICQYQCSVHCDPPEPIYFTGTAIVRVIEIFSTHFHTTNSQSRLFGAHASLPAHLTAWVTQTTRPVWHDMCIGWVVDNLYASCNYAYLN